MKYTIQIVINQPVGKVSDLFVNPENYGKWQPGLVKYEPVTANAGEEGGEARIVHQIGKRELVMKERILNKDLPHLYHVKYSNDMVVNIQQNHFEKEDDNTTRWISHNEFRFSGFMKMVSWFTKGSFKRQTEKYMKQFKEFAEMQASS